MKWLTRKTLINCLIPRWSPSFAGICCLALAMTVQAEVMNKAEGGFNLKIETDVPVEAATAYEAFFDINDWWVVSHTWFGKRESLVIEPRAGGCFCEIDGENQVHHMLVTYVQPGVELKMTGGLGPLQMMGLHGGMSWRFEPRQSGGSRILLSYNVSGYAPGGLLDLADIVDAVLTDQLNALARHIQAQD